MMLELIYNPLKEASLDTYILYIEIGIFVVKFFAPGVLNLKSVFLTLSETIKDST